MKKLSLRPYPGVVGLCSSPDEVRKQFKKLTGEVFKSDIDDTGGITVYAAVPGNAMYLVYAFDTPTLAHEFGHVLLDLFGMLGHNPTDGDGEPFCYLLGTLMEEAMK